MTAQTIMVMMTPPRMKNMPRFPMVGSALFAKRTVQQQTHVQMIKLTKTCHAFGAKSGWYNAYIETVWFPRIADIEAAPRIQARQFQKPAKKPQTRPYFPAVTEAQW